MGEIRFVGPGKTPEYPYPVCKKNRIYHRCLMWTEKSQPEGKWIMLEMRFTEGWYFSVCIRERCLIIFLPMTLKIILNIKDFM